MYQKSFFIIYSAVIIFLSGCGDQRTSNWSKLEFIQSQPVIEVYNINDTTHKHGDMHFFEANLMDTTGKVVGQTIGYGMLVDIPGKDGMGFEEMDERMTTLIYRFNEKDAIMVQGGLIFNPGDTRIVMEKENYRAIVGGTGKYIGARGQSIVTQKSDGNIQIILELKQD
ncbi:MAG: hypothetical protein ACO29O_05820 [Chitinophagaceae bacterium]